MSTRPCRATAAIATNDESPSVANGGMVTLVVGLLPSEVAGRGVAFQGMATASTAEELAAAVELGN